MEAKGAPWWGYKLRCIGATLVWEKRCPNIFCFKNASNIWTYIKHCKMWFEVSQRVITHVIFDIHWLVTRMQAWAHGAYDGLWGQGHVQRQRRQKGASIFPPKMMNVNPWWWMSTRRQQGLDLSHPKCPILARTGHHQPLEAARSEENCWPFTCCLQNTSTTPWELP